jgi:hypothetical protein
MRLYRKRRREGMQYVHIPLHVTEVEDLIQIGCLGEDQRHEASALSGSYRARLPRQHRHHRVVPQFVVVVDVFVAKRNPEHPLPNQRRNKVLDQILAPTIDEAIGTAPNQPDRTICRSQQQRPGVRRDRSSVKPRYNRAAFHSCKFEQFCVTLCRHRGAPRIGKKSFSQNNFR